MEAVAPARARAKVWDDVLVGLAIAHGFFLLVRPSIALIGLGMWWNANTISHNFIHHPFFRTREINRLFSMYLTLVLGFPQSLWMRRHLEHHGLPERLPERLPENLPERLSDCIPGFSSQSPGSVTPPNILPIEFGLLLLGWGSMLYLEPRFALTVYLPGYLLGIALCGLQGYYEHAGGTVSDYGRVYNLLFFNDGYHVEHHHNPGVHWRDLPGCKIAGSRASRYPPILRWLESINLRALERLTLRHTALQRFVIDRHERAIRSLLIEIPPVKRVGIVGGGLFPRTAIILSRLMPRAALTLIDMSALNLAIARSFVSDEVREINRQFEPEEPCDFDLLVIPLSFVGARRAIYERPPAPAVLVHDWIWKPLGITSVVSWLLLKRLNLVIR
jgi:hypothetical protein